MNGRGDEYGRSSDLTELIDDSTVMLIWYGSNNAGIGFYDEFWSRPDWSPNYIVVIAPEMAMRIMTGARGRHGRSLSAITVNRRASTTYIVITSHTVILLSLLISLDLY